MPAASLSGPDRRLSPPCLFMALITPVKTNGVACFENSRMITAECRQGPDEQSTPPLFYKSYHSGFQFSFRDQFQRQIRTDRKSLIHSLSQTIWGERAFLRFNPQPMPGPVWKLPLPRETCLAPLLFFCAFRCAKTPLPRRAFYFNNLKSFSFKTKREENVLYFFTALQFLLLWFYCKPLYCVGSLTSAQKGSTEI